MKNTTILFSINVFVISSILGSTLFTNPLFVDKGKCNIFSIFITLVTDKKPCGVGKTEMIDLAGTYLSSITENISEITSVTPTPFTNIPVTGGNIATDTGEFLDFNEVTSTPKVIFTNTKMKKEKEKDDIAHPTEVITENPEIEEQHTPTSYPIYTPAVDATDVPTALVENPTPEFYDENTAPSEIVPTPVPTQQELSEP